MKRKPAIAALVLLSGALCTIGPIACGRPAPAPGSIRFASGPPTIDGLRLVESTDTANVLVRPDVRMADYTEILVDPFMISYTSPRGAPKEAVRTLDRETEERLANVLRDAFIQTMDYSPDFEVVEEPGPQAVRVQGWLYDLIVDEPPTDDPRNFPLCFAELTVVLTVRHSETAQALARVAERKQLSCKEGQEGRFYTASWVKVRKGVRPWAKHLRRWLEDLRQVTPTSAG